MQVAVVDSDAGRSGMNRKSYAFDRVFDQESTQSQVCVRACVYSRAYDHKIN